MKESPGADGLRVPDDFDASSLDKVRQVTASYSETNSVAWRSFAAAWNGVAYRFRAADEFNRDFALAMEAGDAPPSEERYEQEQALFGFAFSVLSTLECFCFAAYCLGSLARTDIFPMTKDQDLRFYPNKVRDAFIDAFPTDRLTNALEELLKAPEYSQLSDLRNVLIHRGMLPRSILLSVGTSPHAKTGAYIASNPKSLSSNWQFDQPVDVKLTQSLRDWLGLVLGELLASAAHFADSRLAIEQPPSNRR